MSVHSHAPYSALEERAHALSHGAGALLALAGTVALVLKAAPTGSLTAVVAVLVFGASMVVLYGASAAYHSAVEPELRRRLRVVDHAAIYLLIAGTYTPFALLVLPATWGWSLFAVIWGLAALGIVFKVFFTGRFNALSVTIYVTMGWCGVVAAKPLLAALAPAGVTLLVAGGLAYTGGVAFYVLKRMPYHHVLWHLFVLAGSALHFAAVYSHVLPESP